jgi:hypothetical protein
MHKECTNCKKWVFNASQKECDTCVKKTGVLEDLKNSMKANTTIEDLFDNTNMIITHGNIILEDKEIMMLVDLFYHAKSPDLRTADQVFLHLHRSNQLVNMWDGVGV